MQGTPKTAKFRKAEKSSSAAASFEFESRVSAALLGDKCA
jgi:hypothetical protein